MDRGGGSSKHGGGDLVVYTDSKYAFSPVTSWPLCNDDIEMLWLKLKLKLTRPTYVCVLYRPQSGNVDNFVDVLEKRILDIRGEGEAGVLIMGDTNINTMPRNRSDSD